MKTIKHKEILDEFMGKKGTKEREAFENELKADVLAFKLKESRKKKNLTQQQLAKKAGMGKANFKH